LTDENSREKSDGTARQPEPFHYHLRKRSMSMRQLTRDMQSERISAPSII